MGFLSVCTWKDFGDGGDGGFDICVDGLCWLGLLVVVDSVFFLM